MHENGNRGGSSLLAMVALGFAAGAATGLLLAPARGKETRERLGELGRQAGGMLESGLAPMSGTLTGSPSNLQRAAGDVKHAAGDLKSAAGRAMDEVKDRIG